MERIKKAIIIAAGEGSRLRPVTLTTPKPLVKVNGVRMIDTEIRALKSNGIHEIYIVTGYKKELFYDAFRDNPDITILENPHYLDGNNITSLYVARDYLPGSFILEGDLIISDPSVIDPIIEKSCYYASWATETDEWTLSLTDDIICDYSTTGGIDSYRLWGISMWTERDGKVLSELIRAQIEDVRDWSIYWDVVALSNTPNSFELSIRPISNDSVVEIDTYSELLSADPSYIK